MNIHRMYKKQEEESYAFILKKDEKNAYRWLFYEGGGICFLKNMPIHPITKVYSVKVNDLPTEMKHEIFKWYFNK